jgi:hypothetical protein
LLSAKYNKIKKYISLGNTANKKKIRGGEDGGLEAERKTIKNTIF